MPLSQRPASYSALGRVPCAKWHDEQQQQQQN